MSGDAPAKNRKWTPGELLHGYRLRAVLGDGAFSRVYLAEDPKSHIAYALKHVVSTGEKEDRWVDQMRAEWEIGRKLDHPALRASDEEVAADALRLDDPRLPEPLAAVVAAHGG